MQGSSLRISLPERLRLRRRSDPLRSEERETASLARRRLWVVAPVADGC